MREGSHGRRVSGINQRMVFLRWVVDGDEWRKSVKVSGQGRGELGER